MGGGLMQLVAYGAQDIYLTGNPQITFFKVVYRRHTNFSMETIEQTFESSPGFGKKVTATISRNGDLIHGMHISYVMNDLVVTSDANASKVIFPKFGAGLIKDINIEIGGQEIDRHYAHWLSVREDLFEENPTRLAGIKNVDTNNPLGQQVANGYIRGLFTKFQSLVGNFFIDADPGIRSIREHTHDFFIPLQFWFCKNPGLALPLIALQYHEVKINWTLPNADELGDTELFADSNFSNVKLLADYIYLDTDERRRFAQVSHEYLIEQLQFDEVQSDITLKLNFNHPVKELIWCGVPRVNPMAGASSTYSESQFDLKGHYYHSQLTTQQKLDGGMGQSNLNLDGQPSTQIVGNHTSSSSDFNITLKLNGHERFSPQGITYFSRKQIYDHHTGPGSTSDQDAICVYSFALKPEEHQPSGTCNFSRIDSAQLVFNRRPFCTGPDEEQDVSVNRIRVYAINYNVLRIMSGMGGLAYSN